MTPEALAQLHAACFTQPPPWTVHAFAELLADPGCVVCMRASQQELAAFALFRVVLDEAELLTLATAPLARRSGHARSLLREGLALVKARGAEICFLEVSVDNSAARALYHSAGFVQQGRRKAYYRAAGHAPVDALILRAPVL
ncbi:MAG: ribosomal-protein-alanine N-acetyltransferase [Rhodobacteraceae bacterium]|nr:MAG: ribosomal-protein-alanine N-acetyltransferase [Paracoccaceae bacterium]